MSDVQLDLQQVPARAELLLAAEPGDDAPGRPIYARPDPDGEGAGRISTAHAAAAAARANPAASSVRTPS